jgi:sigma-B regulation protein RsbU (phosphoserine phosphatase)
MLCRRRQNPRFEYLSGYPIGMVSDPAYEEHTLKLLPGDRLYLFTDGITDAMNQAEEDFGMERFVSAVEDSSSLPLEEALEFIVDRVRGWASESGLQDDASILGVEFLES